MTTHAIGPMTIDFTPPIYQGGIELAVGDFMSVTWPSNAFIDEEDSSLLSHYQWALGKKSTCILSSVSFYL